MHCVKTLAGEAETYGGDSVDLIEDEEVDL
jgi:hypothetical protein